MAILSKIRDRSIALIAVIGLALFAFVLDPSTLTDFFDSSKINEVGEVDGESISRQEYAEALDTYKTRNNSNISNMQAARTEAPEKHQKPHMLRTTRTREQVKHIGGSMIAKNTNQKTTLFLI